MGLPIVSRQLKPGAAVLLHNRTSDAGSLAQGGGGRALEFEEEGVFDGPFACGHAVGVRGVDEYVVDQLDAFCKAGRGCGNEDEEEMRFGLEEERDSRWIKEWTYGCQRLGS